MVLNGDPDTAKAQSLIKLGDTDIKNVSEFKYLGVMLSTMNSERMIEDHFSSTIGKFMT